MKGKYGPKKTLFKKSILVSPRKRLYFYSINCSTRKLSLDIRKYTLLYNDRLLSVVLTKAYIS